MIHETRSVQDVIDFLNQIAAVDPAAIYALIEARVPCNKSLADHPTVQVNAGPAEGDPSKVGFLGVLNGLFGTDEKGWGPITLVIDDNRNVSFHRTVHNA